MVNPPVMIGLTGTHHTGKTIIARRIEMELRAIGFTVTRTGGLARRAAELGFPKMLHHTAESTEWIIAAGAATALEAGRSADVVLVDRTPHDALAYYAAALKQRGEHVEGDDAERLSSVVDALTRRYTLLLATVLDPEIPLGEHPRKDPAYLDPGYRTAVDQILFRSLDDAGTAHTAVTSSSHDAAVQTAMAAVMQAVIA
ncbi:hypothetical protein [Kitasatospora herbaricolor]|uniref:hypothetical protein n=1 Tax=Kitasatospora herbaricolor TaxID=68217 RepID=UPI0036DE9E37